MFPLQAAGMGHWLKPTTIQERIVFFIGGLAVLHPSLLSDMLGIALIAFGLFSQKVLGPIPVIGIRPAGVSTSGP
jgi:TRAP-type uncharacterized transport system fused permease subunit